MGEERGTNASVSGGAALRHALVHSSPAARHTPFVWPRRTRPHRVCIPPPPWPPHPPLTSAPARQASYLPHLTARRGCCGVSFFPHRLRIGARARALLSPWTLTFSSSPHNNTHRCGYPHVAPILLGGRQFQRLSQRAAPGRARAGRGGAVQGKEEQSHECFFFFFFFRGRQGERARTRHTLLPTGLRARVHMCI